MFRRLLIANRGEIAVRVARACRELGIESVAVHSTIDARAPHVLAADRAVAIGPPAAIDSYLSIRAVLEAARTTGAEAVHPGYGFLAENPDFARACEGAGLVFIGPPADAIARLGSKIQARRLMDAAGVPVVPGAIPDDQSDEGILAAIGRLGVPALVKASAGGGGKGMRLVRDLPEARERIQAARREAVAAFGDGTLYVERRLERPRHVEIQILADARGGVAHLFERDCSAQRRHQKIVEESPAPALAARLREQMGSAAVAAGRAAGYRNAGTVEFLVEGEGDAARFYFLEMNTRLQVEHPVTEAVTGVDLVHAQIAIAAGDPLPWTQAGPSPRGHAIECRIYAERPEQGFLPQAGVLRRYREPSGPGIRIDSGVVEGQEVSVHYDPLLSKLIAWGATREAALARASAALRGYVVLGLHTNIPFLLRLLEHPAFRTGAIDTGFVERESAALLTDAGPPDPFVLAAAAAAGGPATGASGREARDPWTTLQGWRG